MRLFSFMPRWPKPNIKLLSSDPTRWVIIFSSRMYPHTRYSTGHHAETVAAAWAHMPAMMDWYGMHGS